jgi:hypothetical protein
MKRRLSQALSGAVIFSIAGSLWAAYAAYALKGIAEFWLIGAAIAIAAFMLIVVSKLKQRVAQLPAERSTPEIDRRTARAGRLFVTVNIVQGLAIFLAVQVGYNLHTFEYLAPAVSVVVGIHFMALAGAFETPSHWTVGGLMCVLALGAVLSVADHAMWGVILGFGNAVILWGSGVVRIQRVMSET